MNHAQGGATNTHDGRKEFAMTRTRLKLTGPMPVAVTRSDGTGIDRA